MTRATHEATPSQQATRARRAMPSRKASAHRTVDELSFTARDARGLMVWWNFTPPSTQYWPAHFDLGRAYAYEALELMRDPNLQPEQDRALGFILAAVARWLPSVAGTAAAGIADGFFATIGEAAAGSATVHAPGRA